MVEKFSIENTKHSQKIGSLTLMRIPDFFQKGAFSQNIKTPAVILTGFFAKKSFCGCFEKTVWGTSPEAPLDGVSHIRNL